MTNYANMAPTIMNALAPAHVFYVSGNLQEQIGCRQNAWLCSLICVVEENKNSVIYHLPLLSMMMYHCCYYIIVWISS